MVDFKAYGYILAGLIIISAGAGLLLKVITFDQFMVAEGAAVAVLAATSASRATVASTTARVQGVMGTGNGSESGIGKP